jgi:hypothetical protein
MNNPATDSNKNLVLGPRCGLTTRQTGRLTVGSNIILTSTWMGLLRLSEWQGLKAQLNQSAERCDSADILVLKLLCNERSAYTERPTPPLVKEEAPLLNTCMSRREQKSWSPISILPEARNDCAGENQQQLNRPAEWITCSQWWFSCDMVASLQKTWARKHRKIHGWEPLASNAWWRRRSLNIWSSNLLST